MDGKMKTDIVNYAKTIKKVLVKLGKDPENKKEFSELEKKLGLAAGKGRDNDYQRWSMDSVFMSIAYLVAKSSHDSNTQHGAVIVDEKNHIVSTGFNGFIPGSFDNILPNERTGGYKYDNIIHAERNALSQSVVADLSGCRIFVTGIPCNKCLRAISARGIKEIIIGDVGHVLPDNFWEMHYFLTITHDLQVHRFNGMIVDTSSTIIIGQENGETEKSNQHGNL